MRPKIKRVFFALGLLAAVLLSTCGSAYAQAGVTILPGVLPDGATYIIEVPSNWNKTLFLYSHGYVVPGTANPATDVGDPFTRFFMLSNGYALAGSSYAGTGWAIQQALPDQILVLDAFNGIFGHPDRTIAWGHSLGGIITAGLIQTNPDRFTAALPMCGVLSGGVATWNTALDAEFAFKTLLAPGSGLQVVNITDAGLNFETAEGFLAAAQSTAQGRARIALAAALGDTPGWFTPLSPEPGSTDFAAQEENQFLWDAEVDFPFVFAFRQELELRAGGNVSWNTHVDYRKQFAHSIDQEEVKALYKEAGLDLESDLGALEDAARIDADPQAVQYLEQNIIFNGQIGIPVLTLHTKGDGLVVVENESAYKNVVDEEGNAKFLRQDFVDRAGHCAFTPGETIAAVQKLIDRIDTGKWHEEHASDLNAAALALPPGFNVNVVSTPLAPIGAPTPPAFIDFVPARYLRPFDDGKDRCEIGGECN
jgi:pimeloyl-ACP methyl ester carboxylesterase